MGRGHIQRDNIHKFPIFMKNTNLQFQRALVPGKINKSIPIYITVKLPNTIKKILKTIREKSQIAFKDMTVTLPIDLSMATLKVRRLS